MSEDTDPASGADLVSLGVEQPIWERVFHVALLVGVGTRDPSGAHDLAPKRLAMPMGWDNSFGFVCSPAQGTTSTPGGWGRSR